LLFRNPKRTVIIMARIEPLTAPFEPDVADALDRMGPPIGLFRMMVRNVPMATAMQTWGRYELGRTLSLTLREREIVIVRTCARAGGEYEWGVHVAHFGAQAGFDDAQVTSLTHGGSADPCWPVASERRLIDAVDAAQATGDIDDELWARLAAEFTEAQLLDLLALTGWYRAISLIGRATRLDPEPGTPTFVGVRPGA
jgi:alkylhydroperoxidase family enzyme